MNSRQAPRGFDPPVARALDFSILFFSSNEADARDDKYRLVIDAARFADQHGFSAVWVPERHFHPFGGLYPNPSVLGAALAMVTRKVRIRAGSVVLPLQNPLRVAEEWAVVDNLSGGRVDVAFAQGWNVRDFVLAPASYTDRLPILFGGIETVKRLWLGETVELPDGRGNTVRVRVYPQPQQAELNVWLTCSGAAERFVEAGKIGANVLTGLLFQSVEQLDERLAELVGPRHGLVDVGGAEHLAPRLQAVVEPLFLAALVHPGLRSDEVFVAYACPAQQRVEGQSARTRVGIEALGACRGFVEYAPGDGEILAAHGIGRYLD